MLGFGHLALRESFNTRLTLSVLLIAISQFNFGFDQQEFASAQAMDAFAKQFGKYNAETRTYALPTTWLSFFNGFNYLGQALGVVIGSMISKRYGRRMCMFTMSCWACVAATVVVTSRSPNQILVGRVLNYIYSGMELASVPIFQAEITPKQARGFIVGTYQISLYLGGLMINCVARGTSSLPSNAAWQIPFGLFYIIPTFVAACIWFIPESPRWLLMVDRREDALDSLRKLRKGKFSEHEIQRELQATAAGLEQELELGSFFEIFQGTNRTRTIVVISANFFFQATGQIFTSIYGALFAKSIGTINPFTVTVILALVNVITAGTAMMLIDRVGRRNMIFAGATIQLGALMTMGGLGAVNAPDYGVKSGIIAMMMIFTCGYSLGWAPTAHILSSEIPSTSLRDMTYRTASVLNICTQFTVSFTLPYLLNAPYANLGSKVGFIYGSMAVCSLVFAYFFVPNCAGRSLEDIHYLFNSRAPVRHFEKVKIDAERDFHEGKLN
ncbi:hypothetical protein N7507_007203 [Penicillium longicatenatum]|nr:hypothetical protein N7507_007203 [Penicillium longicatenatum]